MSLFELAKNSGIKYYLCPEKTREMHCTDEQLIAFAQLVRSAALEDAANKFDGTTPYNWTAADGYANAFDISAELRYMAAEVSNVK